MRTRYKTLLLVVSIIWACSAHSASAAIMQGLPCDNNCAAACDCAKCCKDNFSTFYNYGASGVSSADWWAWYSAGQPKGIGCDEIALVAWFATAVMCVLGGEQVMPCLALAWTLYYIDLVLCYNTCNNGICS